MSDIKLTTKQTRAIGEIATADAEHATHNESATDVYGQVMGKPVGQDFDRMSAIYDAYVNLWEHARSAVETTETTDSTAGLFYVLTRRYIMGDDDTMSQLHDSHESPVMTHQAATDYARVVTSTDLGILDARFEITVEKVECWDCPNQAVAQFATGDFCADHAPVEAVETATETDQAAPVADPLFPFRVRIHPAHDLFMRGVRFATVKRATAKRVHLTTDAGQPVSVRPEFIMPASDTGTLTWVIVLPGEGDVDETFAPGYLDALAFARSVHGATAVIRLTGWESN